MACYVLSIVLNITSSNQTTWMNGVIAEETEGTERMRVKKCYKNIVLQNNIKFEWN